MKAVACMRPSAAGGPLSLRNVEIPVPTAGDRDLLVRIGAVAVNPVDCKVRRRFEPSGNEMRILGWDAVGEVVAVGNSASGFTVGDAVWYAGALDRQGCNAEYQLVDERLAARKPARLSNAESAALPLTAITAWELLFDHLQIGMREVDRNGHAAEVLLVIGAAGGVGSILVQLAKTLTGATVIGTASREPSRNWVAGLGADHVIDHRLPLAPQIENLGVRHVTHVASLTHTDQYFDQAADLLEPFGRIAMIDDPATPLDPMKLKPKSLSLHVEFMFARSRFETADMNEQGRMLARVARLIDQGRLRTTLSRNMGPINADNLEKAHAEIESGRTIGKIVLEGF